MMEETKLLKEVEVIYNDGTKETFTEGLFVKAKDAPNNTRSVNLSVFNMDFNGINCYLASLFSILFNNEEGEN